MNAHWGWMVRANLTTFNLQPRSSSACWTAQLLSAFQGLRGCELYVRAVQTGHAITMQELTADLKHRMRGVWRDAELVDPNTHNNKSAIYHSWFAIPFSKNERKSITVPQYLHLDLSKHVMCNVSNSACVRILWKSRQQRGLKMVLAYVTNVLVNMFRTSCMLIYFAKTIEFVSWGNIFPFCLHLFLRTFQQPKLFCCNRSTTNLFMISFFSRTIDFFFFFEPMNLFVAGRDQSAADQPNNLAERFTPIVTIVRRSGVSIFLRCRWCKLLWQCTLLGVRSSEGNPVSWCFMKSTSVIQYSQRSVATTMSASGFVYWMWKLPFLSS